MDITYFIAWCQQVTYLLDVFNSLCFCYGFVGKTMNQWGNKGVNRSTQSDA